LIAAVLGITVMALVCSSPSSPFSAGLKFPIRLEPNAGCRVDWKLKRF
jgi:hypothetical protein